MSYSKTVVYPLTGDVDGVNRDFTVPTLFELGTLIVAINGLIYQPDDEQFGYAELNSTTVRFDTAPKAGSVLQGIYAEPQAEGSPFSGGTIP